MIVFPNAKINIGLYITEKRPDGFHEIETVFYPVHGFADCLEFFESKELTFENLGIQIDAPVEKNLCIKAWNIFKKYYDIPPIHMVLYKNIPFGGGLGGGSADASFLLSAINEHFNIGAPTEELEKMALEIGSDCPFFINNKPIFAQGRGEIFSPVSMSLANYWIVLVKPDVTVGTAEAYRGVTPYKRQQKLADVIPTNIADWKDIVVNDFEQSIFKSHPEIEAAKNKLYEAGAVYASMSGSGATVYGLFEKETKISNMPVVWQGYLQ